MVSDADRESRAGEEFAALSGMERREAQSKSPRLLSKIGTVGAAEDVKTTTSRVGAVKEAWDVLGLGNHRE